MLIVALDSATAHESVALLRDGHLLGEACLDVAALPSRRLLPEVTRLLEAAGLGARDVDGWVVGAGPGSFTGLRVALATVAGLAFGTGRPCLGLSNLAALGHWAGARGLPVAALIDAGRDEVYAALYDSQGAPVIAPERARPAAFAARLPEAVLFAGDGAERYRALLEEARPGACFQLGPAFLAHSLAQLARAAFAGGAGVPAEALRPHYLRDAHIRGAGPSL
jgi:tRNA threonylcarbamoyladenosine biosynthesis protein TsaB